MTHNPIPKKTLYALYDKICETLEDKDSRTQLIKSLQYSRASSQNFGRIETLPADDE